MKNVMSITFFTINQLLTLNLQLLPKNYLEFLGILLPRNYLDTSQNSIRLFKCYYKFLAVHLYGY